MGKQSSRIYYKKKDHKDIYFNKSYHSAMYIGDKLVWRKIFDKRIFIHNEPANFKKNGAEMITVSIEEKKAYISENQSNDLINYGEDYSPNAILEEPQWTLGGLSISRTTAGTFSKPAQYYYVNRELVFNELFLEKINAVISGSGMSIMKYPAFFTCVENKINVTLFNGIDGSVLYPSFNYALIPYSSDLCTDNYRFSIVNALPSGYFFSGKDVDFFNLSEYAYFQSSRQSGFGTGDNYVLQCDINGNNKTLKLENYGYQQNGLLDRDTSVYFLCAYEEKIFILESRYVESEEGNDFKYLNIVEVVEIDNMEIINHFPIRGFLSNIALNNLEGIVYPILLQPFTFIYKITKGVDIGKVYKIEISDSGVNFDVYDEFSFDVDMFNENGEQIGTMSVSSGNSDLFNNVFGIDLFGIQVDYNSCIEYSEIGWNHGGRHGIYYDDSLSCAYIYYIERLENYYGNFFIKLE